MRRNISNIVICITVLLSMLTPSYVFAEAPGDTFTVTVNCGGLEGEVVASPSNATLISADRWCVRGGTVQATAKAGNVGTASVYFLTKDVTDVSDPIQPKEVAPGVNIGGGSVNVSNPTTSPDPNNGSGQQGGIPQTNEPIEPQQSSNANLQSLSISKGTLTPEFSADVTEYSVNLEKDVTSLTIEASAEDENATVSGTGEVSLEPGDNTLTVGVTAEDGTLKQYVIKAYVDETPEVYITYNGEKLGVVKIVNHTQVPASFEETTVTLEGKEVNAWKSNLRNLIIIYMVNEINNVYNFYLYDETSKSITSVYKPIALLGEDVAIVDIPEHLQSRAGMKYSEVTVDGQSFMGWSFDDAKFENYVLLYLMDDKGKMQYYLYEKSGNTLQLYSDQAAATQESYDELNDNLKLCTMIVIALAITNVLTLLVLFIVIFKKRKSKDKVVLQAQRDANVQATMIHEEEEEEIIPFDAWKYEDMPKQEDDHTLHLKPYEEEQHLFENNEDINNE